ncbi:hypothetical protein [Fimbriiglobus ruber]|uniref:Type II toxin-antitoxin system RelE/ParE family toxin n=1 Tax=Fimbriiglobus ruber TaxID=1908690 RepID=A0A225E7X2_9BACT|nr:hypothetical protein [Fimbriiglobus ruber]OWK45609.1 hypothetical protein FRUB_01940 [Fimbriiglobus ruber]
MVASKYTLHRRALMALHQLSGEEQATVRDRLDALAGVPLAQWPAAGAKKLATAEPLYLFHVDGTWRVILRAVAGQPPEALDIFQQERLELFAGIGD